MTRGLALLTAPIDFEGQALAERLSTQLLAGAAVIAFIAGYLMHSVRLLVTIFEVGTVIAAIVCIPPWPFYNKHPVQWLPPLPANPDSRVPPADVADR